MIDLQTAVNDYRHRCAQSTVIDYPLVWGGHYNGNFLLGEYGIPRLPEMEAVLGNVAFGVMAPFGFTDAVQTSYLILDGAAVPAYKRSLFVSRLACLVQGGVLTTSWTIPYQISDYGTVLDEARVELYYGPRIHLALSEIVNQRQLTPPRDRTFEAAYQACLVQLNEILT